MNECVDVIVTYNRKNLLEENIGALREQTFPRHDILIIDNASTDDTKEMVQSIEDDRIIYVNTGSNLGGAGGFSFGIEEAIRRGYKYAWIMDDDSIPERGALQSLIQKAKALNDDFSFIAGLVYWTDGKLFDMNLPNYTCRSKHEANYELIRDYKLLPIKTCSFVGCFVNIEVAKSTSLPIADFFIYGDDIEYTTRLQKIKPAYLDLDCSIVHKAPSNAGSDVALADKNRIERFYLQARNGVYIARENQTMPKTIKLTLGKIRRIVLFAPDNKVKRIITVLKGFWAGMFFHPNIKMPVLDENGKNE